MGRNENEMVDAGTVRNSTTLSFAALGEIQDGLIAETLTAELRKAVCDVQARRIPGKRTVTLKIELEPVGYKQDGVEVVTDTTALRFHADSTYPKRGGFVAHGDVGGRDGEMVIELPSREERGNVAKLAGA